MLAWLAADEIVFARGLGTIAESAGEEPPFAERAWGFRADASSSSPYRFLAVVPKRGPYPDDATRLARVGTARSVRILFGPPPLAGRGSYAAVAEPGGPAAMRERLRRDLTARAGRLLDLSPATPERPLFTRTSKDAPAALRTMVALGALGLLAALLLPGVARRRPDSPDAARPLPIPLLLGGPAAFAAAGVLAVFAATARVTLGAAPGFVALPPGLALAAAALAGFSRARAFVVRELPELAAAACVAAGFAALGASALGAWLLHTHGFRGADAAVVAASVVAVALLPVTRRR
jgi:hypothetical protein